MTTLHQNHWVGSPSPSSSARWEGISDGDVTMPHLTNLAVALDCRLTICHSVAFKGPNCKHTRHRVDHSHSRNHKSLRISQNGSKSLPTFLELLQPTPHEHRLEIANAHASCQGALRICALAFLPPTPTSFSGFCLRSASV